MFQISVHCHETSSTNTKSFKRMESQEIPRRVPSILRTKKKTEESQIGLRLHTKEDHKGVTCMSYRIETPIWEGVISVYYIHDSMVFVYEKHPVGINQCDGSPNVFPTYFMFFSFTCFS